MFMKGFLCYSDNLHTLGQVRVEDNL
jgi:hypothetical protein